MLVTRGSRRRRRGRATSDVPADRPISVAIGDATLLVDVRSGPLCGLKSDIFRGPRSAMSRCEQVQQQERTRCNNRNGRIRLTPCPPSRPTRSAISSSTRRSDLLRCWGLCCLGCVIGMMSLVEATSMSRRTRMAPRCIGPENFRGAMIIDAPSMFHSSAILN